jgi:starvation-inducible DNA-binding protein
MSNKPVAKALYQLLADSYGGMLQTQNIHWNIEGDQFYSLHKLTQDIYTEQFAAIDDIAERLRAIGEKVDAAGLIKASNIKIGNNVTDLLNSQIVLAKSANDLIDAAGKQEDKVSEDLGIGRKTVHDKNAWMIKSQIK